MSSSKLARILLEGLEAREAKEVLEALADSMASRISSGRVRAREVVPLEISLMSLRSSSADNKARGNVEASRPLSVAKTSCLHLKSTSWMP